MKHGHSGNYPSRTYRAWTAMKKRCNYPKTNGYKRYGGQGISVCERWANSFPNFLEDMGECPSDIHTLDRFPNRKGNYEPNNCRWATQDEQIANKDKTIHIIYEGESIPLFLLAKKFNFPVKLLYRRVIGLKWDINKALTYPHKDSFNLIFFEGEKYNLAQLGKKFNIPRKTLHDRLKRGWDLKCALNTPIDPVFNQKNGAANVNSKLIEGVNTFTHEKKIFYGLKEAALYVKGAKSNIANVIAGTLKTYKKWTFKHI